MKKNILTLSAVLAAFFITGFSTPVLYGDTQSIYDFTMNDINGASVSLAEFKGKVILIVNVASRCGLTPQYKSLQEIYEKYREKGLVVLGFPANNFMEQEPGTDKEIKEFCSLSYGVQFPMFSKISVKGADIHPLYKYLTEAATNPGFAGEIRWNFDKFLIGGKGEMLKRFHPKTAPDAEEVVKAIEAAL